MTHVSLQHNMILLNTLSVQNFFSVPLARVDGHSYQGKIERRAIEVMECEESFSVLFIFS